MTHGQPPRGVSLRPVGDKSHSTFGKPKGSYCDLDPTWGVGFPWWMDDGWLEDWWLTDDD